MIRTLIALLGVVLATPVAAGAADTLQAFLDRGDTLAARFEQRQFNDARRLLESSSGHMLLRRPGQFRWEYTEPFVQQIISDGERVWVYDADLEQVSVRPWNAALQGSPAALLSAEQPIGELFHVREDSAPVDVSSPLEWVELRPRESDSTFVVLRVGMRGEELAAMELTDAFGQTTELRFSEVRTGAEMAPDAFQFTVPEGVDVIEELAAPR